MTTPANEMVEIEQNQETGEVLTANGVPLTPANEWREELINNFPKPDEFVDREAYMDEHDYSRFKEELRALLIAHDGWWNTRLEFEKTQARLSAFREIFHSKEFQTLNKTLIKAGRNAGEPTEYAV
jgi:hypothetical protein